MSACEQGCCAMGVKLPEGTHVKYSESWLFLLVTRVIGELHVLVDGAPAEVSSD